jgi:pyrroline-5-carboxylate reductase
MGKRVAVIGGGNMGGALIEGFLKSGKFTASDIAVADLSESTRWRFEAMGVGTYANSWEAVTEADLVIIAVKPWYVEAVAQDIRSFLKPGTLLVSVAAGVPLEALEEFFGADMPVFRAIPNIAAALGSSMSFISCAEQNEKQASAVLELFGMVGTAALVPESQLDAAMVVASCGTAYALRYLRASMEAGIQMGLTAGLSRTAVAQTMKGAAELILNSDLHPEAAIDQVTTPGGVTIVGLNAMEQKGVTSAVIEGHLAAFHYVKNK